MCDQMLFPGTHPAWECAFRQKCLVTLHGAMSKRGLAKESQYQSPP